VEEVQEEPDILVAVVVEEEVQEGVDTLRTVYFLACMLIIQ
jgi:hypothetical protein